MAHAPEIKLPVKADIAPVIAVIDVIVKHLTALRDDLAALEPGTERHAPKHAAGCDLMLGHRVPGECQPSAEGPAT